MSEAEIDEILEAHNYLLGFLLLHLVFALPTDEVTDQPSLFLTLRKGIEEDLQTEGARGLATGILDSVQATLKRAIEDRLDNAESLAAAARVWQQAREKIKTSE